MSHPSKVVIVGPLAVLREQLTTEFVRLGYAQSTVARQLQLLAHLSRWMSARGVGAGELSWADIAFSVRTMTCPAFIGVHRRR